MKISVTLKSGETVTKVFNYPAVVIGRSNTCDLYINDRELSDRHLMIEEIAGQFFVSDLESQSGVTINKKQLFAYEMVQLQPGEKINAGGFEFEVMDLPPKEIKKDQPAPAEPEASSTQLSPPDLTGTFKFKVAKPKKKKVSALQLGLVALILFLAGWQMMSGKNRASEAKPGETFSHVRDEFLTNYDAFDTIKNCVERQDICLELGISEDLGEGIYLRPGEVFIYTWPKRFLDDPMFERIRHLPEALELISMRRLLSTELLRAFQQKKYGQIHLVIKESELSPPIVIRFHERYFVSNERDRLRTELDDVVKGRSPTAQFWDYAGKIVRIQRP